MSLTAPHRGPSSKRAKKLVSVKLLTGPELKIYVHAKSKLQDVFNQVVNHHNLRETEYFGLAFLKDDEYQFVNLDDKIHKHAPKVWRSGEGFDALGNALVKLHFRVQFYVDQIVLLREKITRHLYYIQLKQNSLHYKLPLSEERCFQLASFSLQTDFGNYTPSKHSPGYFDPREYFPAWVMEHHGDTYLSNHLPAMHNDLRGVPSCEAQLKFIKEASLPPAAYNLHFYRLKKRKTDKTYTAWVGICPSGINIYEESSAGFKDIISTFLWPDIGKINFEKKKFMIRTKGWKEERKFTYYSDSDVKSKYLLTLCRVSHMFEMAVQPKLLEIQHLQAYDDARLSRASYTSSGGVRCCPGGKGTKDQRYSVVSDTSSNTTSGIVSDRMHISFDESEEELREIIIDSPPHIGEGGVVTVLATPVLTTTPLVNRIRRYTPCSPRHNLRYVDVKTPVTRSVSAHSQVSANSLFDDRLTPRQLTPTSSGRRSLIAAQTIAHKPPLVGGDAIHPLQSLSSSPGGAFNNSAQQSHNGRVALNEQAIAHHLKPQIYELTPASYQLVTTNKPGDVIHSLQKHPPSPWNYSTATPVFDFPSTYVDPYSGERYATSHQSLLDPVYANSYPQPVIHNNAPVQPSQLYTHTLHPARAYRGGISPPSYRTQQQQQHHQQHHNAYGHSLHATPYANIPPASLIIQTTHSYSPNNPVYIANSTPHPASVPHQQFALTPLHPLSRTPSRAENVRETLAQMSLTPDPLHFTDSGLDIRSPELYSLPASSSWTPGNINRASCDSGVVISPDSVYVNIQAMLLQNAELFDHNRNMAAAGGEYSLKAEYDTNPSALNGCSELDARMAQVMATQPIASQTITNKPMVSQAFTSQALASPAMASQAVASHAMVSQAMDDTENSDWDDEPSVTATLPDTHSLTTNSSVSTDTSTVDGAATPAATQSKQEILLPELEEIRGKGTEVSIPLIAALFNDKSLLATCTKEKRNSVHEKDSRRLSMSYPNRSKQIAGLDLTRPFSWHSESFDLDEQLAAHGSFKGDNNRSMPQQLYSVQYSNAPTMLSSETGLFYEGRRSSVVVSQHNIPARLNSGGHTSDETNIRHNNNLTQYVGLA